MQHNKLLKLIMIAILLIVIIIIALFIFVPDKILKPFIETKEIPSQQEVILPVPPEMDNKSVQIPPVIIGSESGNNKKISEGIGAGGSGSAGAPSMSNDLPHLQVCPSSLDIEYLIDYKQTITPTDDEVYLGIRNNNQLPEFIGIIVDDYNEGTLHINGLGLSVLKSLLITSWWRPLNLQTQHTFSVLLTSESCQPISSTVTVFFPPTEGDYLD